MFSGKLCRFLLKNHLGHTLNYEDVPVWDKFGLPSRYLVMESIDYAEYMILSLLVIAWCILHSLMISVSVTGYLKNHLGPNFRFYRLFYNLIASSKYNTYIL
ncbi:MAG: hypothetical protein ACYTEE_09940, partial [Planctomycetota bacterium]